MTAFLGTAVSGCSASEEMFFNESSATLTSQIMIFTSEGRISTVKGVGIFPDGSIIPVAGFDERLLKGRQETYKKVAQLLAPLRSYSGTEGTPRKWGDIISCDSQTDDKTVAHILWGGEDIKASDHADSEFRFSCQSSKSDDAKQRIKAAIELIGIEIEIVEESADAS